jgi:hypothetical protein
MRAASPPRQMERENEMIVISHRLFVWEKRTAILLPGPVRQAIIMTDPCFLKAYKRRYHEIYPYG